MKEKLLHPPLRILLADDDPDDRFFFAKALLSISVETQLATVNDGEKLITYLTKDPGTLPDVLFLDLNMPRKNGSECLTEIRANKKMKDLPVVIYSTSLNEEIADLLYDNGASYYMQKCDLPQLIPQLEWLLTIFSEKSYKRPSRSKFILSSEQLK